MALQGLVIVGSDTVSRPLARLSAATEVENHFRGLLTPHFVLKASPVWLEEGWYFPSVPTLSERAGPLPSSPGPPPSMLPL